VHGGDTAPWLDREVGGVWREVVVAGGTLVAVSCMVAMALAAPTASAATCLSQAVHSHCDMALTATRGGVRCSGKVAGGRFRGCALISSRRQAANGAGTPLLAGGQERCGQQQPA